MKLETLAEAELTEITPLLCRSGVGALAWWRIRNTPLANSTNSDAAAELHEVYRRFRLSALIHEREIAYVFSLLRAEGIEAVLVKGWAIARRYPDRALRPYGDIDVCVAPHQFAQAERALRCLESIEGHYVDLHAGFEEVGRTKPEDIRRLRGLHRFEDSRPDRFSRGLQARKSQLLTVLRNLRNLRITPDPPNSENDWDELFSRSLVVECGGEPVRIPCDEDHLRLLCMHLLRSGVRRPLWLVDVALLLEQVSSLKSQVSGSTPDTLKPETRNLKPGFDWSICLGRNPVHANWVRTTIALAHELLGANIALVPSPKFPVPGQIRTGSRSDGVSNSVESLLPRWLVPAVLKQWGRERVQSHATTNRHWTLDVGLWTSLYSRWDNPIRATAAVGGQFNNWPRLPYRIAESVMRSRELPKHVLGKRGKGERVKGNPLRPNAGEGLLTAVQPTQRAAFGQSR